MNVLQPSAKVLARELRGAANRGVAECVLRIIEHLELDGDCEDIRAAIREVGVKFFGGKEHAIRAAMASTCFPALRDKVRACEAAAKPVDTEGVDLKALQQHVALMRELHDAGRDMVAQWPTEVVGQVAASTVSYTHLTLPTILRV